MLSKTEKIRRLKKLLEKSSSVKVEDIDDPDFKSWRHLVERTFENVFGRESVEFVHFRKLHFCHLIMVSYGNNDHIEKSRIQFREDFKLLKNSIAQYIEDLEEQSIDDVLEKPDGGSNYITKVFISHASKDVAIVEEMIEILEAIGLASDQIFCTSLDGYGIDLGENFLDRLKEEISSDSLVIFMLSENFYSSPICLCEMGASWVLSKEHIPVLVPPLDFSKMTGVFPLSQGFKITEPKKLNLFKEKIEKLFAIENNISFTVWERKRDRTIAKINEHVKQKTETT